MWNALSKYYEMYECVIEKSYIDMEFFFYMIIYIYLFFLFKISWMLWKNILTVINYRLYKIFTNSVLVFFFFFPKRLDTT